MSDKMLSRNGQNYEAERSKSVDLNQLVVSPLDPLLEKGSVVQKKTENNHEGSKNVDDTYSNYGSKSNKSRVRSTTSRLNLEMEALRLKERFENEECMERLRMIQSKKEIAFKELELKMKMLEEEGVTDDGSQGTMSERSMYRDQDQVRNWIRKCDPDRVANSERKPDPVFPWEGKFEERRAHRVASFL
ncbi:uncharacterized protein LOC123309759 [Coccinella septempunctata]|uniref:uncharacterized protein LOC123309759 n=1 Tax=Coccinella septempunctata TaxID=41139 RepID=UPI001D08BAD6|nr:uncharacterized protein LOC123309759 [Coccinella septempunctata]